MNLGTHRLGRDPCYIIAELSCNHAGELSKAKRLIRAAHHAGADAVKFQHYTAATMGNTDRPITDGPWAGQTQGALYDAAQMPWEWTPALVELAASLGLDWLSTPYDRTALDYLTQTDWPVAPVAMKVASFELTDLPFLDAVAATGAPVIASTGMATLAEVTAALAQLPRTQTALLHCVSAYPCPPGMANLPRIETLAQYYHVPVGFSDHTASIGVPVAAVAAGAVLIEKHLKLDWIDYIDDTPDEAFSLDPGQFKAMVTGIREAEAALAPSSTALAEAPSQQFRRAPGGARGSYNAAR